MSTDEVANAAPVARCWSVFTTTFRKANPLPRTTMPSAATSSTSTAVIPTPACNESPVRNLLG
ncbi:hypothetical protein [Micromonospora sp. NPDC003776]